MIYRSEVKVTRDAINSMNEMDIDIKRELALQLINSIPIEVLEKIINFKEFNPFIANKYNSEYRELLLHLKKMNEIQYEANINIK